MYECTEARHQKVEYMSDEKDEYEEYPIYSSVAKYHCSEVVECCTEHTSCKPECEETDVAENVTEDTCGHVVCVPQSCSDIDQRISSRSVEDVDCKC